MSYNVIFTDELYHHGVKGQKWGVRRYQNSDGSLTAAGKARYDAKEANKEARQARNDWASARRNFIRKESRDNSRQKKKEYYESVENLKNKRAKAKEEKIKATRLAVKEYNKAYDKASSEADKADAYWRKTQEQISGKPGKKFVKKTKVDKVIRSIKNDTAEAKKYKKMCDEAMKKFDTVDKLWDESDKKYRDTGKNRVAAIINNIKYS